MTLGSQPLQAVWKQGGILDVPRYPIGMTGRLDGMRPLMSPCAVLFLVSWKLSWYPIIV